MSARDTKQLQINGVKPSPDETAIWWCWVLSIPKPDNPLRGGSITKNQDQPFLCLACTGGPGCTGGGEDHNRIFNMKAVDAGKDILVPIFSTEYSTAELGANATHDQLLSHAREDVNNALLELIIDSVPLQSLEQYYVESGPFQVYLPPNHILENNIAPGTYQAACAGYYLKLNHFPSGRHMIKFGGTAQNGFHTSVTYVMNSPRSTDD
jgi:hypothetical protein